MSKKYIAFDFSMNKPAMVTLINDKLEYYVFPSKISKSNKEKLENCGVHVYERGLEPVGKLNEHELICEHLRRARDLASLICDKIIRILNKEGINEDDYDQIIIGNEGFSFGSTGAAMLDLAGYKYILMNSLIIMGFEKFKTFSPQTLKRIAGANRKDGKLGMIRNLADENIPFELLNDDLWGIHKFMWTLNNDPEYLMNSKLSNYIQCVDDLADAYWCLKCCIIECDDKDAIISNENIDQINKYLQRDELN